MRRGDKLIVDYAGQTVPVVDATTGEITQTQVFVAVLGASNFTYACATRTQKATDWVASIIATQEFIGGVPRLLVQLWHGQWKEGKCKNSRNGGNSGQEFKTR